MNYLQRNTLWIWMGMYLIFLWLVSGWYTISMFYVWRDLDYWDFVVSGTCSTLMSHVSQCSYVRYAFIVMVSSSVCGLLLSFLLIALQVSAMSHIGSVKLASKLQSFQSLKIHTCRRRTSITS
ncbi:hypothetical protein D3C80_1829460 [compost metagenome]